MIHPFQHVDSRLLQYWRGIYQLPLATPLIGEHLLRYHPKIIEKILQSCSVTPNIWTKKDLSLYSRVLQNPQRARASYLLYNTFLTQELIPILHGRYHKQRLLVKTRLLVGKNDPVIHKTQLNGFEKYTKDMHVELLAQCGHFIPEEKPELLAQRITKLFQ